MPLLLESQEFIPKGLHAGPQMRELQISPYLCLVPQCRHQRVSHRSRSRKRNGARSSIFSTSTNRFRPGQVKNDQRTRRERLSLYERKPWSARKLPRMSQFLMEGNGKELVRQMDHRESQGPDWEYNSQLESSIQGNSIYFERNWKERKSKNTFKIQ